MFNDLREYHTCNLVSKTGNGNSLQKQSLLYLHVLVEYMTSKWVLLWEHQHTAPLLFIVIECE